MVQYKIFFRYEAMGEKLHEEGTDHRGTEGVL